MTEPVETLGGSCLCGAVAFEVWSPFLRFAHCYCGRCRKATGTGHATNLYCAPEHFRWLRGEERVARFDLPSAKSFATVFCTLCGSPLPHLTRNGSRMVVPAGSLDAAPSMPLQAQIFWGSRAAWACGQEPAPKFEELPDWWRK